MTANFGESDKEVGLEDQVCTAPLNPLTADEYEAAFNTGVKAGIKKREIRIEALRAAARIMASHSDEFGNNGHHVGEATKDLAEQFAAWLEG